MADCSSSSIPVIITCIESVQQDKPSLNISTLKLKYPGNNESIILKLKFAELPTDRPGEISGKLNGPDERFDIQGSVLNSFSDPFFIEASILPWLCR